MAFRTWAGIVVIAGTAALGTPAVARSLSAAEFTEIWSAVFGYWTAARACGDPLQTTTMEDAFRRTMNYGRARDLLPDIARQFEQDPAFYLAEGEKRYLAQQWVACSDVGRYVDQLDQVTRKLP